MRRSSSSGVSVQFGPCTSASSSMYGTPSCSASARPIVDLPLPLAEAVTATFLIAAGGSRWARSPTSRRGNRARRGDRRRPRRARCRDTPRRRRRHTRSRSGNPFSEQARIDRAAALLAVEVRAVAPAEKPEPVGKTVELDRERVGHARLEPAVRAGGDAAEHRAALPAVAQGLCRRLEPPDREHVRGVAARDDHDVRGRDLLRRPLRNAEGERDIGGALPRAQAASNASTARSASPVAVGRNTTCGFATPASSSIRSSSGDAGSPARKPPPPIATMCPRMAASSHDRAIRSPGPPANLTVQRPGVLCEDHADALRLRLR